MTVNARPDWNITEINKKRLNDRRVSQPTRGSASLCTKLTPRELKDAGDPLNAIPPRTGDSASSGGAAAQPGLQLEWVLLMAVLGHANSLDGDSVYRLLATFSLR